MRLHTKLFNFHEETYKVNIHLPEDTQDAYPLLVVLDGERYENLFVDMINLFGPVSDYTCIYPYAVVTISLPKLGNNRARFYNATRHHEHYHLIEKLKTASYEYGGAEQFQQFLENDILQYVNEKIKVNHKKKVIFGHSLTGLYLLHQISTHPSVFTDYIIMSPSVWWNNREALQYDYSQLKEHSCKVWFSAGELEGDLTGDILLLEEKLPSSNTTVKIFKDENHSSIVHTSIHSAFRYVYDKMDYATYVEKHRSKVKR